jgi:hypothetical protein
VPISIAAMLSRVGWSPIKHHSVDTRNFE